MLEITDPARQLIRDAWRRGQVLVVAAPWRDYAWTGALFARWRSADDRDTLDDHVRVGDGEWVYVAPELLPEVRRRRLRLELHAILGLFPGIAVRELDPAPALAIDSSALWPRIRGH